MNTDAGVGCAWTAGHHRDTRPTGELAVGGGHHRRAALLPGHDKRELLGVVVQPVEQREEALTRHPESPVRAERDELFHHRVPRQPVGAHR